MYALMIFTLSWTMFIGTPYHSKPDCEAAGKEATKGHWINFTCVDLPPMQMQSPPPHQD